MRSNGGNVFPITFSVSRPPGSGPCARDLDHRAESNRDHTLKKCCSMGCLSSPPTAEHKHHGASRRAGNNENYSVASQAAMQECCGGGGGGCQTTVRSMSGLRPRVQPRAAGHHPHSAICRRTPADLPGSCRVGITGLAGLQITVVFLRDISDV